jgi:hypothetical protein
MPPGAPTSSKTSASRVAVVGVSWLGDHRVAHRERGGRLPGQQVQRQVPGGDQRGDADGLAQGVVEHPRRGVAAGLVVAHGTGEEPEVGDGPRDVHGGGEVDGLAVVGGLRLGELRQPPLDARGDGVEQIRALRGAAAAPGSRQRLLPGGDRRLHVRLTGAGDL